MRDVGIIALSIVIALMLVKTGVLAEILTSTRETKLIGTFIAGLFFTSVFTTAPALVTLGEIARANSVALTALVGALGATVGDLIIFRFVRDMASEHLAELLSHQKPSKRVKALLRLRMVRWLTFFAGGLILASPLPDELGIGLLGFSKMGTFWFIPLSLVSNFVGIFLVGLIAKTL